MAIFRRLKKDIGIEEEPERKKTTTKTQSKKKESETSEAKALEERAKKEPSNGSLKKVLQKERPEVDYEEKMKKISPSNNKGDSDWLKSKGQLAVDVYQTDSEFCVQAPIAGVDQESLDIAIENEMLVIKGEREEPDRDEEKKYFYQECYWGPFSRQVILPDDIDPEKIKASLKKGILLITIPKTRAVKKKVVIEMD